MTEEFLNSAIAEDVHYNKKSTLSMRPYTEAVTLIVAILLTFYLQKEDLQVQALERQGLPAALKFRLNGLVGSNQY